MKIITLKTSFNFDAAHRLVGYNGKCANLHGHIWNVDIEIKGNNKQLNAQGILWDFTNVKYLKEMFDHKTILYDCIENRELIHAIEETCNDNCLYLMYCNPTAENLGNEILKWLKEDNNKLKYKVTVWESPKSSCEVEE